MGAINEIRRLKGMVTLSVRGKETATGGFDWCNAIIDALITAGVAIGAAYSTAVSDGLITNSELMSIAGVAFVAFIGWISLKRGLKTK